MEELKELFTKEVSDKVQAYDIEEANRKDAKVKNYAEKIQKVIDSNPLNIQMFKLVLTL